jgi:hypothetical protein
MRAGLRTITEYASFCAKYAAFKASASWQSSHVLFSHYKQALTQLRIIELLWGETKGRH